MDRNKKRINESIVIAAAVTALLLVIYFISEMVGYNKMDLGASPKRFSEVLDEWPRFLILGMFFFSGVFWWRVSSKEAEYVICTKCMETAEKGKDISKSCMKCGGQLEELEGIYERHPELSSVNDRPIKRPQFNTCHECGKTFYSEDCPDSRCPDCLF